MINNGSNKHRLFKRITQPFSNTHSILLLAILASMLAGRAHSWDFRLATEGGTDKRTIYISMSSPAISKCTNRPPVILFTCTEDGEGQIYFGNVCPPLVETENDSFAAELVIYESQSFLFSFSSYQNSRRIFAVHNLTNRHDRSLNFDIFRSIFRNSGDIKLRYPTSEGALEEVVFSTSARREVDSQAKVFCGW